MNEELLTAAKSIQLRNMLNILEVLRIHNSNSKSATIRKAMIGVNPGMTAIENLVEYGLIDLKDMGRVHWISINNRGREALKHWRSFDRFFFGEIK